MSGNRTDDPIARARSEMSGAGGIRTLVADMPSQHSPAELRPHSKTKTQSGWRDLHPQPLAPEASNLLLKYTPEISAVELEGIAPSSLVSQTSILLLNYSSITQTSSRRQDLHLQSHGPGPRAFLLGHSTRREDRSSRPNPCELVPLV